MLGYVKDEQKMKLVFRASKLKYAALGLLLVSLSAIAGDSVTINGQTYTCTSSCDVTTHEDGSYTVTDCCGGQVSTIYP